MKETGVHYGRDGVEYTDHPVRLPLPAITRVPQIIQALGVVSSGRENAKHQTKEVTKKKQIFKIVRKKHRGKNIIVPVATIDSIQKKDLIPTFYERNSNLSNPLVTEAKKTELEGKIQQHPQEQGDNLLAQQSCQLHQQDYDPRSPENQAAHQNLMQLLLGTTDLTTKIN